jgi:hypothetical protein
MAKVLSYYLKVVKYLNPSLSEQAAKAAAQALLNEAKKSERDNPGTTYITGPERDYRKAMRELESTGATTSGASAIQNPRAGGATGTGYYGLTGDAATLAQLNVEIYGLKGTLAASKPGSKKYNDALAKLKAAEAKQNAITSKTKAAADAKAKEKAAAEQKKLEDAAARAKDYGTEAEQKAANDKLKKFKTENPATPTPPKPGDTKPKVLDTDGDGIPDAVDKNPKVFDKPAPGGNAGGSGGGGGGNTGQTPPPPPADSGPNVKELWISYLRTTFASLEDKTQKAEIDLLLKNAKDAKWDEDTFMEALKGTVWWQATYPSIRSFFLETHDPRNASTFAEKVSNTMDTMLGKLEALGVTVRQVDPATGKVIDNTDFVKGIALKSIENNWDDDQLEQYLATQSSIIFSGGGTLGSFYDRIAQQAYLYGVPLDETMKKTINTSLLDPLDGRDANYWIKTVKDMAYDAPENKPFLASLQAGRNLYEVTNSYRTQMANLLEVDSTAISWNDLMSKVVDNSTGNARTFADFTKQLKSDPLWQYTRNAKETYSNTALDIAKMFGFVG